jgi:NADH:quinone reductase (non-electrogenic)
MVAMSKVVIIGGGFAGLNAAKKLKRKSAEVLILDRTNHHLFQPLLYQVASAGLSPSDVAVPIREVFRNQPNVIVNMAEVVEIKKDEKHVVLAGGEKVAYDYLILAPGARHSYFGHDEWEVNAPGIKTLADALRIRERLLISFEKAERSDSISAAEKYLNFVVIGGGPTGVEIAGAIAEIAHQTMLKNFRRINPQKTKIYLVEGTGQVLPPYPSHLGERAKADLEKLGVQVVLNTMVTEIDKTGVHLGDRFIPARNVIWAAGNQASPLLKTLDVELDRQGRVMVKPDCSVPGNPEIFVIGDAAHCLGKNEKPLPGLAPVAVQQGRFVAKIIGKQQLPEKRPKFVYRDKGTMATIGKHKAVAMVGDFTFTGYFAWLAWGVIHIGYLVGFRSRMLVFINWIFQYIAGQRGARLINRPLEQDK